jgi:uncharacterized protein YjbI with pentapeptide repeats
MKRRRTLLALLLALVILVLTTMIINVSTWPAWTGIQNKTFWDFVKDFSGAIALLALIYTYFRDRAQDREAQQRTRAERAREQERAKEERAHEQLLAFEQSQEATWQNYLNKMTDLLLSNQLRYSSEDSEVQSIARTQTLTTLRSLNPNRKRNVIEFLYESGLINREANIISLSGADLHNGYLRGIGLQGANLREAHLDDADLQTSTLREADMSKARLNYVNLKATYMREVDLRDAYLIRSNLSYSDLTKSDLRDTVLYETNLHRANLDEADLRGADLRGANLDEADLRGANLSEAKYNSATKWPKGFDPEAAGAVKREHDPIYAPRDSIWPPE